MAWENPSKRRSSPHQDNWPLTKRQEQVLEFIRTHIAGYGYPPTLREIGDRLNICSTNGVDDHLRALERKGHIKVRPRVSRGIQLTGKGERNEHAEVRQALGLPRDAPLDIVLDQIRALWSALRPSSP
ncbi:MAG TPA: hypothetical protein VLV83_24095 [Acidobacteriota bacterium]|nr:hypothetical protein [Acidobacteriota bacterium]